VEIEGILVGGFSECTGLQIETEVETYNEGGLNEYWHQFRAGRNMDRWYSSGESL
jgi:hypothetical protein